MLAEMEPLLEEERRRLEEADRVTREVLDLYIDI